MRGIFFESEDAEAAAARLRGEGWQAEVVRERLAGEDDDEDHPWAVLSDAPPVPLELVVEAYDGWLDTDTGSDTADTADTGDTGGSGGSGRVAPPPLDLPRAPRRIKRPDATRPGRD